MKFIWKGIFGSLIVFVISVILCQGETMAQNQSPYELGRPDTRPATRQDDRRKSSTPSKTERIDREQSNDQSSRRVETLADQTILIGAHVPGGSIGFRPRRDFSFEFRGSTGSDINIVTGRVNHHFFLYTGGNFYWGLEFGSVDFEGEISEGSGTLFGGYLGFQKYLGNNLSVKIDAGPFVNTLEDDETGVELTETGFVINTGITVNFF